MMPLTFTVKKLFSIVIENIWIPVFIQVRRISWDTGIFGSEVFSLSGLLVKAEKFDDSIWALLMAHEAGLWPSCYSDLPRCRMDVKKAGFGFIPPENLYLISPWMLHPWVRGAGNSQIVLSAGIRPHMDIPCENSSALSGTKLQCTESGVAPVRCYLILASLKSQCLRSTGSYFFNTSFSVILRGFFLVT